MWLLCQSIYGFNFINGFAFLFGGIIFALCLILVWIRFRGIKFFDDSLCVYNLFRKRRLHYDDIKSICVIKAHPALYATKKTRYAVGHEYTICFLTNDLSTEKVQSGVTHNDYILRTETESDFLISLKYNEDLFISILRLVNCPIYILSKSLENLDMLSILSDNNCRKIENIDNLSAFIKNV
jgi:hypothetical protein